MFPSMSVRQRVLNQQFQVAKTALENKTSETCRMNGQLEKRLEILCCCGKSSHDGSISSDGRCQKRIRYTEVGYLFSPKDEELIGYFLDAKINDDDVMFRDIHDVNLYAFSPQVLAAQFKGVNGKEWYFFTPRIRKYPNGVRPNRAAGDGYWKATGADKKVNSEGKTIGFKKALVFYKGNPPRGNKTGWIMHEYVSKKPSDIKKTDPTDMTLNRWVLCRIYEKIHKKQAADNEEPDNNLGQDIPQVSTNDDNPSQYIAEVSRGLQIHDNNNDDDNTFAASDTSVANHQNTVIEDEMVPLSEYYGQLPQTYPQNVILPQYDHYHPMVDQFSADYFDLYNRDDITAQPISPCGSSESSVDILQFLDENISFSPEHESQIPGDMTTKTI